MQNSQISFNQAKSQCADEKIHLPGAIQPHGVLIAITEPSLTIVQASQSALPLFGIAPQDLIDQPIELLIGTRQKDELARLLAADPIILNPLHLTVSCKIDEREFDAVIHRADGLLLIEFEEFINNQNQTEQALEFFRTSTQAIARLLACHDKQILLESAAASVRALTGFERVLIYLFDSEWNGTVLAECKALEAKSYLGLKFPASDIPPQARELYKRLRLRLLVNVDAAPSPILPANNPLTGNPLDLSESVLLAMSPVHIEYLKNMEVAASMSISLISNGELKGLIACHHTTPKRVEYRVRQACNFLSRVLCQQIDIIEERETFRRTAELKDARKDLLLHISHQDDLASAIAGSGNLLQVAGGRGAAVIWDGRLFLVGRTPDEEQVLNLVHELSKTNLIAFVTDSTSTYFPAAKSISDSASGLLAIRIATGSSNWLLWFRPEQLKEVNWAGKQEIVEPEACLHPRQSFELWKEEVVGKAVPWLNCEVQSVIELRTEILDMVLTILEKKRAHDLEKQVEELDSLSQRLQIASDAARHASQQKSEMVSVVSHDLRAPLTSIKGALSLLKHGVDDKVNGEKLLSIAYAGCDYLLKLINDLLNLDSIESGSIRLDLVEVSLRELIDQAFQLVSSSSDSQGIRLEARVGDVTVVADRDRLLQVLVNLISNAIKFSPQKSRIFVSALSSHGATTIRVADQGRGLPFEFRQSIFQKFKQVEAGDRGEKGGVGLGLAISKTIVEAHGGTIGVESEIDMGSTFWFTLPSRRFVTTAVKPASQDEINLRAELVVSEQKLSERTRERDDFELRLIKSDHELSVAQAEFAETARRHTASLANLALNVAQVENQLQESDANLTERTKDFAASKIELKAILHERACFESALKDLRIPISRATQMLQYIAAGTVAADKQVEILNQIIDANKGMLSGAEQIAKVALELSQRTSQSAQRTAKLEESNAELIIIMQQREDFIAALTHDLQNPLIGATRILERFAASSFSERQNEQDKILSFVIESNKSMLRMIRNMLDIYRQESGSLAPVIESVDVSELLKKCLIELSLNIQDKNLNLILDTSDALQSIQTDRILLRRVLSNLLDNGVKFSPQGGELIVSANFDEKQWSISVKDSGIGMSDNQIENIFQRFWQTKEGRGKGIGTGLGLFSSKMIMDALGGKIVCSSNEKGGTTFTISMQMPRQFDD